MSDSLFFGLFKSCLARRCMGVGVGAQHPAISATAISLSLISLNPPFCGADNISPIFVESSGSNLMDLIADDEGPPGHKKDKERDK